MTLQCPNDDVLKQYANGQLGRDQATDLIDHLLHCNDCRRHLQEVESGADPFIDMLVEAAGLAGDCVLDEPQFESALRAVSAPKKK